MRWRAALQWRSPLSSLQVPMASRPAFIRSTLLFVIAASAFAVQAQSPGEISARARTAMEAAFARTDANGDGKLSPEEAEHMPAIAMLFKQLDRNSDGALSLEEFAVGYLAAS
jgi:Ca2+-binding EF-hand superfamily protein